MPALDARRVKLTIFFPIDDPLSIDDALSASIGIRAARRSTSRSVTLYSADMTPLSASQRRRRHGRGRGKGDGGSGGGGAPPSPRVHVHQRARAGGSG